MTTEALNHNLELPVSRIPTHVLSQVFCIIRDEVTNILVTNPWIHPAHYQPVSWNAVTQVCHTWREVAIDTPMLWTDIILSVLPGGHKWAKEMLYRSKQCPLVIIADFTPVGVQRIDSLISVFDDMKASLARCRALSLRGVDTSVLSSLSSGGDLSQLESLQITVERGASNMTILPGQDVQITLSGPTQGASNITVVPHEFISRAKSLRSLQIQDGDIHLHNPSLLNLTRLALYRIPNLTVQSLVAALSRMSALGVLHLMGSTLYADVAEDNNVVTTSENRVFLKPISRLFLASNISSIDLFLQRVQLSPTCEVRLKAETDIHVASEFGQIFSWTSEHFRPPQTSDGTLHATIPQNFLQSFCLYIGYNVVEVRAFYEVVSHDKLVDGSPIFELIFGFTEAEPPEALLRSLLVSLPLSRIVFLEVSNALDSFDLYSAVWMEAFARIPTIKTIFLDASASGFFPLLHSPNFPFPNLTSITVNDLDVCDEEILESLRGRSNLDAPLKEILFSNDRGLPPDDILHQLCEVVEHVGIHDFGVTLRDG